MNVNKNKTTKFQNNAKKEEDKLEN